MHTLTYIPLAAAEAAKGVADFCGEVGGGGMWHGQWRDLLKLMSTPVAALLQHPSKARAMKWLAGKGGTGGVRDVWFSGANNVAALYTYAEDQISNILSFARDSDTNSNLKCVL